MARILEKLVYMKNYKSYMAEGCKKTGLPMLNKDTYGEYTNIYLSKTRCAKIKQPVKDDEDPVAFYRIPHGYIPLYKREKR